MSDLIELIERLQSHMGKADMGEVLADCRLAADKITALRERVAEMEAAITAAIDCGMVPKSSAREGGAVRHTRAAQVADMLRDAILSKQEASHEG